jgi:hypothetical protein
LEAVQKKLESLSIIVNIEKVNESMKWTCFTCGQFVQKFSLVVSHVGKHKQDQGKTNSLLDAIYEDWRREKQVNEVHECQDHNQCLVTV